MRRSLLMVLVLGLLLTVPLVAHHSFSAEFDNQKPITVKGWVTKIDWTNPHVWIYLNVKDEKSGAMTNWGFEMGPPHLLQGSGWTNKSLKIGDEIVVGGFLAKNGTKRMSVNNQVGVKFAATGQNVGGRGNQQLNNATQ
jgi:uncharacterized protein DUF6152